MFSSTSPPPKPKESLSEDAGRYRTVRGRFGRCGIAILRPNPKQEVESDTEEETSSISLGKGGSRLQRGTIRMDESMNYVGKIKRGFVYLYKHREIVGQFPKNDWEVTSKVP